MSNPCDDCVVKPSCTSVCPDKENYGVFLEMGARQLKSSLRHYTSKGTQVPKSIQDQSLFHGRKLIIHNLEVYRIQNNNKGKRLYKDEHVPFPITKRGRFL